MDGKRLVPQANWINHAHTSRGLQTNLSTLLTRTTFVRWVAAFVCLFASVWMLGVDGSEGGESQVYNFFNQLIQDVHGQWSEE